ncbi:MAG TPA: hypothetical protein VHV51_03205 [Polyangiaceae bacterium]|jgi:hypothetical protein|nr:hypothetical protein [Polyangiaceae bacterium]
MNRFFLHSLGFALTLSGLLASSIAAAQDTPPLTGPSTDTQGKPLNPPAPALNPTPKLVAVDAFAGALMMDMGDVNDRLSQNGYGKTLPIVFPILGGQGFGLFGHFLLGGSGAGVLARSVDGPMGPAGATKVSASGAWGTVDLGYQLLRVNGFLLAPVISLGGYGMDLDINSKADQSFNDAVTSPTRSANLTRHGFVGGVSIIAKTIVIGRDSHFANARSGWSLGLRVGGLYSIPTRGWKSDDASITGGPTFGLRGGYAALSLGAGTW